VALGVESATASTILWSEDFSNGLSGITLTDRSGNPEKLFSDGGKDYICIYGNDNAADYSKGSGCPRAVTNSPNWTPLKNEESSFLAFEDTDSEGAGIPLTFTWSDIEVAGASELTFSGKFYNSDTSSMRWDKNDYVKLTAVQGSTETELVHVTMDPSHEDNYNAHPYDIAQSPALKLESKIVNTISKTFAVTSEPLTLKLEINVNAEKEEMGIAALSLVGAPTPIVAALPTTEPTEPGCYLFEQHGYTGSDATKAADWSCKQSDSAWKKDSWGMSQGISTSHHGCFITRKNQISNLCGTTPVMKWVAALPTTEPTEPGCYTFQQYGYTGSDAKFLGRTGKHCAQSGSIWNKDNNAMASTKEGCLIDRKANLVNWCGATPVMKWLEEKCWRKMPTGCNSVLTDAGSDGNGLEWFVDSNAADEDGCEARETYYNDYCGKIHSALSHWGVGTSDHVPPPVESIDVEMSVMNETVATFTEGKQLALRNEIARELEVSADDIIITIGRIPNKISRRLTASDPDLEWLFITITIKLQPGTATQEVDKLEAPEFADNIAAATGIITEFEQFKPRHGSSICATCKWLAKEGSTHGHVKVTHYLNSQAYGEMGLQHKCFHSVDGTCKCMCTGEPVDDIPYRNGEEKHGRLADGPEEGVPGFSFHPAN
jgi:hypothetical protein